MPGHYTDAPACRMLATHCCCCGRPLLDSVSVETGMGPICRDRHGIGELDSENRDEANELTAAAAVAAQAGLVYEVERISAKIAALGFDGLADAIRNRFAAAARNVKIEIRSEDGRLVVKTPYRRARAAEFTAAWRAVPGRRYVGNGENSIPATTRARRAVFALLKDFFPGVYGSGPRGLFRVPTSQTATPEETAA